MNDDLTRACITACQKCAAQCEQCAVTCSLSVNVNSLARCLELSIYCADMCRLTASLLQRGELQALRFSALCAEICDICAAECERFEDASCLRCVLACKECAEMCRKLATRELRKADTGLNEVRESA